MAAEREQVRIVDFYTEVVLPALAERLDQAFPEFGWRRDARGWVATNEEHTHARLGVRAERVVAHGPAPRGFLVHGGEPMLWTAYLAGGEPPRGAEFVRVVAELADRAGVDTAPIERETPRDRRAELLEEFFKLAQRELVSDRGDTARAYLEQRGFRCRRHRDFGARRRPVVRAHGARPAGERLQRRRDQGERTLRGRTVAWSVVRRLA